MTGPRLAAVDLAIELDGHEIIPGLSLAVAPGALTVIVGANGSGKSTLLRGMTRLIKPVRGAVTLDGVDTATLAPKALARRLALLPQSPQAPSGISVSDLVARGRYPHQSLLRQWSADDEAAVAEALEATGTTDLAERRVEELSGGQRQRVWVAMVLAQQTELVLLDEPTTFLDIAHQYSLLELVRRLVARGRTIVAVLHDLQQAARYADRLVVLKDGRIIAQGPPVDVLTPELIRDAFGLDCHLLTDPATGSILVVPDHPELA